MVLLGGALHGVTQLLCFVSNLPAQKLQKILFDEKFGEKSYFRHENFLKTIFGCFCAGSLPTRLDSVKSSTTPWGPFTLILGFMLMLIRDVQALIFCWSQSRAFLVLSSWGSQSRSFFGFPFLGGARARAFLVFSFLGSWSQSWPSSTGQARVRADF